jgi:hypothetical protein
MLNYTWVASMSNTYPKLFKTLESIHQISFY